MQKIVLVIYNVRSTHNVGSMLRTADGLGVEKVIFSGYTPYPQTDNDERLPHESRKIAASINKTALGAEKTVDWEHQADIYKVIDELRSKHYQICALEQDSQSVDLSSYRPLSKVAIIVGAEVNGLPRAILDKVDKILEIKMIGKKESFNVSVAAAICLYHLRQSGQINIS